MKWDCIIKVMTDFGRPWQAEQANASAFRLVIGTETVTMEKIHPDFRIALAEDFQPGILYTTGLKTWQLHITNPGAVRLEGWVGIRMQSEEAGVDTLLLRWLIVRREKT